jgi:hypothetical protein
MQSRHQLAIFLGRQPPDRLLDLSHSGHGILPNPHPESGQTPPVSRSVGVPPPSARRSPRRPPPVAALYKRRHPGGHRHAATNPRPPPESVSPSGFSTESANHPPPCSPCRREKNPSASPRLRERICLPFAPRPAPPASPDAQNSIELFKKNSAPTRKKSLHFRPAFLPCTRKPMSALQTFFRTSRPPRVSNLLQNFLLTLSTNRR